MQKYKPCKEAESVPNSFYFVDNAVIKEVIIHTAVPALSYSKKARLLQSGATVHCPFIPRKD